jgi:alkanesulfonate monooxygenase SsuD/methylene tetrahydromethanopterin reductase-like flavin-dependent oxidoreductase (luciferase family)
LRSLQFGIQLLARGEGDPATTPFPSHRLMLDDGVHVERLGFDAVWLPDHFYFQQPAGLATFPEVWTLITAIGVKTERITLGTNVIAATFRHPAMLAKMAAALQDLCGGRFVLGIGAGNQVHEHTAMGLDFAHRVGRFKEYLPILRGLLDGDTVTQSGRYFVVQEASLRSVVPPVPVWIASGGPQMFDLTARYGHGWNVAGGRDAAAIHEKYDQFSAACQAVGRDIRDFDICKLSFVAIARSPDAAARMLDELAAKNNQTPEAVAARMLVGTPETIAAHLTALTGAGVNHHILSVAPSEQWPDYREALAFLQQEVVPRVRDAVASPA